MKIKSDNNRTKRMHIHAQVK